MIYQDTLDFAESLDAGDELKHFRHEFLIPRHSAQDAIYLCGNSLGLQPVSAEKYLRSQLNAWKELAVEGWFQGDDPWLEFHYQLKRPLSDLTGAHPEEITVMNSLTVNLHLLLVSFYKPSNKRFKIIMEGGAFPSDQYAVESQVNYHGLEPQKVIIELFPREGELNLRTEDIVAAIGQHANELSLVLFAGVNYYTGQLFDMAAIAEAAHQAGAYAGFDLAHAVGNVPLRLHDWGADFACWCSYKYMNSGPGGISGIFVHEKHFKDAQLNRFAGWWGYRPDKRFLMAPGFDPAKGAEGWQVSTSPILLMAVHKAALDIFERAGGIETLRIKSILLTGYLEFLLKKINKKHQEELFMIITPANPLDRGCQLSIVCKRDGKKTFNYLSENGVIGDWREPDVIRLSPVPLYNSFKDVYSAAKHLDESLVVSE
jgi:kynureninase